MKSLAHFATQIFDTPLAIQQRKLEVIVAALSDRLGLEFDASEIEAARNSPPIQRKSLEVTRDGVCIIPIQGTLLKKAGGMSALSGCSSYQEIGESIAEASSNPNIKGIVLDLDSPGGQVSGMFELCAAISATRGSKPLVASINDSAYSAAYALSSCADRIFITLTGGAGSIGVFSCHVDQSGADKKAGLVFTYIQKGDKKTDGNPHAPLSDTATQSIQAEVNREYDLFTRLCASNRGTSLAKIVGTQAGSYFGEQAVAAGLADEVGTLEDAVAYVTKATATTTNLSTKGITYMTIPDVDILASKEADPEDEKECKASFDPEDDPDAEEDKKDPDDDEDTDKAKKAKAGKAKVKKTSASSEDLTKLIHTCTLAGCPELIASYLSKGYTSEDVTKELLTQRAAKSNASKVQTTIDNTTASNPTGVLDRIERGAAALANESKLTKSQAYASFLMSNPGLYDSYLDERDAAATSRQATNAYVTAMSQRLQNRG